MSGTPPSSTPPPGSKPVWGSYGAGSAAGPAQPSQPTRLESLASGGGQLEPLSRRLLQVVALLSVLLLAVLLNSFLNDGGGPSEDPLALNPVASAAERVEETSGGRMSLFLVYSSPALPTPISASGTGVFNGKADRSRITLELRNPVTGEGLEIVQIEDGDVNYEGGDVLADELPPGKEWVRTDDSDEPEEDETPLSMDDSLEMMNSSGRVKMVGRESVNGKMTRRYRGEIKLVELVDFLREKGKDTEADAYEEILGETPTQISAEGWVDSNKMLRRMRMVMPMPGDPGEPPVTVDMRMDFFAYGAEPEIRIPDPDTVVEGPLDEEEDAPSSSSVS